MSFPGTQQTPHANLRHEEQYEKRPSSSAPPAPRPQTSHESTGLSAFIGAPDPDRQYHTGDTGAQRDGPSATTGPVDTECHRCWRLAVDLLRADVG